MNILYNMAWSSTSLSQFLSKNSCNGPQSNITSYRGGAYKISSRIEFEEFINFYEINIQNKDQPHYLNEVVHKNNEPTRFYMDLDLKLENIADETYIVDTIINAVNSHISSLIGDKILPPTENYVYWYRTKTRQSTKDGSWKIGFHPVWSNMLIDHKDDGILLANRCAISMNKATILGRTDWEKTVDTQVYGTGLRMPFVPKYIKCNECKSVKNKSSSCINCNMNGHIIDNDGKYFLEMVCNMNNEPILCKKNASIRDLLRNSMVSQIPTKFAMEDNASPFKILKIKDIPEPTWYVISPNIARQLSQDNIGLTSYDSNRKYKSMDALSRSDVIFNHIESYLSNTWIDIYPNLQINKIFKCNGLKNPTYNITTFNKYCENNRAEHKAKTIWFRLSSKGSLIRCNCKCTQLRGKDGATLCSDYKSVIRSLGKYKNLLFPPIKSNTPPGDNNSTKLDKWKSYIQLRLDKLRK